MAQAGTTSPSFAIACEVASRKAEGNHEPKSNLQKKIKICAQLK
jgi:hypothetical protein